MILTLYWKYVHIFAWAVQPAREPKPKALGYMTNPFIHVLVVRLRKQRWRSSLGPDQPGFHIWHYM